MDNVFNTCTLDHCPCVNNCANIINVIISPIIRISNRARWVFMVQRRWIVSIIDCELLRSFKLINRMSVGIGEYPITLKTLTALRFTLARSVAVLYEDAVVQVSSAVAKDCDALGQQESICLWVCFTPGPDENPLLGQVHHEKGQHNYNQHCLHVEFGWWLLLRQIA